MTNAVLHTRASLRPVRLGAADVAVERRSDGTILMRSPHPLPAYPRMLTERLAHWATATPDRVFLAQRDKSGAWRTMTYAETYTAVRTIAAALLARELNADRPVAILSGNDIEHALLGLAAMHVGIPYAPISVPYSLMSQDFKKLKAIIEILTPRRHRLRRSDIPAGEPGLHRLPRRPGARASDGGSKPDGAGRGGA